ncbi:hypothetical protein ACHAP3_003386 [Botrytis cinerea]|uniref:Uncharacterized protein n=1 Tax=Botryotinia fuckeliana (strain T4) TaxID=999810 RepID=G2YAA5_BOTF4|nr:predicted protein [Botrytis cinerea T4]
MQSVDVQNDGSEVDAEGWVYRLVDSIAVDHVVSEELVAPPENDAKIPEERARPRYISLCAIAFGPVDGIPFAGEGLRS